MNPQPPLLDYVLRLADNDLVLAQRLSEWVGKGPVLEEDIATTNVGLDLLGQARLWFAYASEVEAAARGRGRSEDELAYRRDGHEFRNLLLVEQPNGSYADTIARQFLFDRWHVLVLRALAASSDARVAEIAQKSLKEAAYHVERSSDWVIRLGDGTDESHRRLQHALDLLWPYTAEFFSATPADDVAVATAVGPAWSALEPAWAAAVTPVLEVATLTLPARTPFLSSGKLGMHSEHLGHLLTEMQYLQRTYPGGTW
jgi:ring-1,2-phenylacetyl-CoA epoxidase subunit PaaC